MVALKLSNDLYFNYKIITFLFIFTLDIICINNNKFKIFLKIFDKTNHYIKNKIFLYLKIKLTLNFFIKKKKRNIIKNIKFKIIVNKINIIKFLKGSNIIKELTPQKVLRKKIN